MKIFEKYVVTCSFFRKVASSRAKNMNVDVLFFIDLTRIVSLVQVFASEGCMGWLCCYNHYVHVPLLHSEIAYLLQLY